MIDLIPRKDWSDLSTGVVASFALPRAAFLRDAARALDLPDADSNLPDDIERRESVEILLVASQLTAFAFNLMLEPLLTPASWNEFEVVLATKAWPKDWPQLQRHFRHYVKVTGEGDLSRFVLMMVVEIHGALVRPISPDIALQKVAGFLPHFRQLNYDTREATLRILQPYRTQGRRDP